MIEVPYIEIGKFPKSGKGRPRRIIFDILKRGCSNSPTKLFWGKILLNMIKND